MAVVDSSVLIHLLRIGRLDLLKRFFGEIKVTEEIYEEIKEGKVGFSEFEDACGDWVRIISGSLKGLKRIAVLENIEEADVSVLLLAERDKDILLSNDYVLIGLARSRGVECLWFIGFVLKCLGKRLINKNEAKKILLDLINSGMRLSNEVYAVVLEEIEKR